MNPDPGGWQADFIDSLKFWAVVALCLLLFTTCLTAMGCASTRTFHPMTGKPEVEVSTFIRQAELVVTYDDPESTGWRRRVEIHHKALSPTLAAVLTIVGAGVGSVAGPGGAVGGGLLGGALGTVLDALGSGTAPDPQAGPPTVPETHRPEGDAQDAPGATIPMNLGERPMGPGFSLCGGLLAPDWCHK